MPGIDQESISALKDAKTKEVYFALVVKNGAVGTMVVNKTSKVPQKKIDEAKKDCGGTATVVGRCFASNGTLTVQTVKDVDANGQTLAKKFAKEAGFSHCDFATNKDAESDKPGSTQTTPQKVGTTTDTSEQANGLKNRLEAILEWCKANKDGLGTKDTVERTIPVARHASDALKQGDLVEAEKKMVLIEKYLNLPKTGDSSGDTSSGSTEPSKTSGGKADELHHRLSTIVKWCNTHKSDEASKDTVERCVPVVQQVSDALKTGDLVEAEKKLGVLEKYLNLSPSQKPEEMQPTRPRRGPPIQNAPQPPNLSSKDSYDRAKLGIDNFKQSPDAGWNTNEAKQTIKSIRVNLLNLITDERNAEDDITRKGTFFDSKDTSYKKNVTDLVTKTMLSIEKVMVDPTKDTGGEIKKVNDAIDLLAIERAHYADLRGIKDDKMIDQRKRKVAAIDKHIGEMRKINGKLRDVLKLKMKPALDLLNSLPALNKSDSNQGDQAMKDFAKTLSENEQMRKDLFESAGPEQCEALCMFLTAQPQTENDKWCRELAVTRASDPEFMDPLCKTAILAESSKAQLGTFFRSNSTATKLATNYAQNSPGGKAYCNSAHARYSELAKGKGTLELDKNKNPKLTDKDIEKNLIAQKKMLGDVVDGMTEDPESVPPEIAKICNTFYEEAKRVSGGNEEFATTQSGGFLMLRVVIPSLTTAGALEVNAIEDAHREVKKKAKENWVKSGKDADKFVPPEMSNSDKSEIAKLQEKQRLVTLQTKGLQNISNGVEFGDKEKFMIPMNDAIKKDGNYTPAATKLRGFLKSVAQRGGSK
ncbi:MAG TPA: hypothetical protein VHX65_04395 [Pirellulales bacterium]|jgi:hypothetical protein|nr:hypothetical protein [Pirellulales bacterium]